jgi:DNA polymerase-4
MGSLPRAIAHLNIIGFRAAVAALVDGDLRNRPYVIAGGSGGRAVALDVSPEAMKEGITPGIALAAAHRIVRDLTVVTPDPAAYLKVNAVLEKIITRYAPLWQNDGAGNIYLDISGTRRLFGPPADCVCHIRNEINAETGIEAAAAMASNKLVCKVASRAIRPEGLIEVRQGDEAAFIAHQDIVLLPGLGPSLLRTIRVTGFREAGELAALTDGEAASLFGKKGLLLRNAARGIDNTAVTMGTGARAIERKADFAEDVIDETIIRGALAALVENGGLEMRREKLGALIIRFAAIYSDGTAAGGIEKRKRLFVLDSEILAAAERVYKKTVTRRIRVRSICLSLEGLLPLGYEPDLFEIENDVRNHQLQEAIDRIQGRYGAGAVMRGVVLAASSMGAGRRLLTAVT